MMLMQMDDEMMLDAYGDGADERMLMMLMDADEMMIRS
jgi:hypothetical protein